MGSFLGLEQGKLVESCLMENIITPFIVLLELSYRADKEGWDFKKCLNFIKMHSKISALTEEFIVDFGSLYNKTKKEMPTIGIADVITLLTTKKKTPGY